MIGHVQRSGVSRAATAVVAGVCVFVATAAFAQQPADTAKRAPGADSGRVEGLRRPPPTDAAPAQPGRRARADEPARPRSAAGASDRLRFGGRRFVQADFDRSGGHGWMEVASIAPGVNIATVVVNRGGARIPIRYLQMTGGGTRCAPTVFVDDMRTPITETDWDLFISLDKLEAIEVYSGASAPPMYRGLDATCGAVVMWTRADAR